MEITSNGWLSSWCRMGTVASFMGDKIGWGLLFLVISFDFKVSVHGIQCSTHGICHHDVRIACSGGRFTSQ